MLILCEKPSVAKDFAGALGCEAKKGYYQKNGIVITYAVGHLFRLCDPETYNPAYKSWDAALLPIIPSVFRYEKIAALSSHIETVKSLLKNNIHDTVIVATDAGREGELIARIILSESGITDISRIKRFWVSEALTKEVILNGLQDARPLSEYNSLSGDGFARQRADWLIGINLTRLMSIGNTVLFSVGRVQTAVLNAVALRNAEAAHFTPVPFIELEASLQSSNGTVVKAWLINPENEKTAFFDDRDYVSSAREYCKENAVTRFQSHSTKETVKPPKLLNITGLQKAAYKLHGYSPEKTLGIAQSLYEKYKCLSYPRTPSRVMGDRNVELFRETFRLLSGCYPHYARLCDESAIRAGNKNIFNSAALEDHHALIPLRRLPENADAAERNVFDIVLKSFFTVCMNDHIYNKKRLIFYIGSYMLRTQINEILQNGFKETVNVQEGHDDHIQEVKKFDEKTCKIIKLDILQKETRPKKEFTIDTLLGFMENPHNEGGEKLAGLGTSATRAAVIKLLFDREYVREERKKLYASRKGLFLLEQLQKNDFLKKIADISQTTEWEKQLSQNPQEFEKSIVQYLKNCMGSTKTEKYSTRPIGVCPCCGNEILEGIKSYYCSGYKSEKPCSFVVFKTISGAAISAEDITLLLSLKPTGMKNCISKSGKKFKAAFYMDRDGKISFQFDTHRKGGKPVLKQTRKEVKNGNPTA
jgi:DNA topoisomerase-3